MINRIKNIDTFNKNILLVFAGTSLVNLSNLLYQLLIAHQFSPADFAAFNSLLSIFMLLAAPLGIIQIPLVKYVAEFKAQGQIKKVKVLLSDLLKKSLILSMLTLFIFYFVSPYIMDKLKITSYSSGYILAVLLALSWITPVFSGGIQGLELFKWLISISIIGGALKLMSAFIFTNLGFNITGALSAFLISSLFVVVFSYLPLKSHISLKKIEGYLDLRGIFAYLFPVAITSFCYSSLISFDIVLVKYFFTPKEAGLYSLAQMVGKIFLFLPGAISVVMFPRTSGLNAKNMDTTSTLRRSLLYASILCITAMLFYNLFPGFTLKVLTGKAFAESIILGRLFSISMAFFALLNIFISYFLSLKDLRFIKYLVTAMLLQFWAIFLFHNSLLQVQLILCANAIFLFLINLMLVYIKKR